MSQLPHDQPNSDIDIISSNDQNIFSRNQSIDELKIKNKDDDFKI